MMQVSGLSRVFNNLNVSIMKKLKYLALAFIAIGFVSCEDNFTEEPTPVGPEGNLEKMTITLEAGKGASEADETRVYLGSFGSKVTYYWEETDKVGMYALTNTSSMENFEAAINELNSNKNLARFQGDIYATGKGAQDLFIYWPYNSSNIASNKTAVEYLKETGVQVLVESQQKQYGYNIVDGAEDHPSVYCINQYGAAVDLITTDDTGVGAFELQHQTAYLQFELYGENTDGQHAFADGGYKVKGMRVELGKFDGTVSGKNSKLDGTFTPVAIAGNYRYGLPEDYNYSENKVSRDDVVFKSTGAATVVSVTLAEEQELKGPSQKLPVLAVVNPALVKKENVNCIRAVVQLVNKEGTEYVERTRYIDLRSLDALKGGDYYKISYKVVDPAEASAQLDAEGHSNCYIVSYPGTYTFNVNIPGNGVNPHNVSDVKDLGIQLNENGKFFEASEATNYEVNWLWASGDSFDAANGKVEDVVTVSLNGESGVLVVKPQAANLSGNLVVALTKTNSTDIIWSWHIWFGAPKDVDMTFPVTRPHDPNNDASYDMQNEHWVMLDRNIGAESADLGTYKSYGLYYQYGRKDPFVGTTNAGSTSTSNHSWENYRQTTYCNTKKFGETEGTVAAWEVASGNSDITQTNSFKYPMHMAYTKFAEHCWVSTDDLAAANTKTLYDPCPLGYKLPSTREWDNLKDVQYMYTTPIARNSGPLGYSVSQNYLTTYTDDEYLNQDSEVATSAHKAYTERINNGNYYVMNTEKSNARTYYIKDFSTTGSTVTINFPNSGILTYDGNAKNVGYNFALWAGGRVEGSNYERAWFGLYSNYDSYGATKEVDWDGDGDYETVTFVAPYNPSSYEYYTISQDVDGLGLGYSTGTGGFRYNDYAAAPARCIKEYNDNVEQ